MQLKVRYCASPSGQVAYSVVGSGPPLLVDPGWITDLRAQLDLLHFGAVIARLAERFTVIRYDRPGCGLSDRTDVDLSFDGQLAALRAVVDAVGVNKLSIFGASQGGQLSVALAVRQPELVDALVLYGTCAAGHDLAPAEIRDSVVALVRAHWGLGMKAIAGAFVADPTSNDLAALAKLQREGADATTAAELLQDYYDSDISELLPQLTARTAVLHRQDDRGTPFELGRRVAALIPDAMFIPLPGSSHLFYHGDWSSVVEAVLDFLAPLEESSPLTARELEVAGLVAHGLTNQAIAHRLGVAPRTAETHVENIRRKLGVRSRAQIAAWVTARPAR